MKKFQVVLCVLLLLGSVLQAQSVKEPRYIKPTNFTKKLTTIVLDKSRSYYSLNDEQASIINIQGPGILRVISRGRFVPNEKGRISYSIHYTLNGSPEEEIEMSNVVRSKSATYKNGALGVPSQLKDFEIELGRGYHTLEFRIGKEDVPVAVRYKFIPTKPKKKDWIAFCPMQPSDPVDLISRESTVSYYRFSMENPLRVEIIGPTELRVFTRIENHYQMKGRINYRIQVRENNEVISTYQLSSRRSEIAVYKEDKDLIPGKAREFVIDVPKGRHVYEILPLDKDKSTVLGRCLIPKKDVSLEN